MIGRNPHVPIIESYAPDGKDRNALRLTFKNITLYFSYNTVVGYNDGSGKLVSENAWSRTTGKHLNWLDGGDTGRRLRKNTFLASLDVALDRAFGKE